MAPDSADVEMDGKFLNLRFPAHSSANYILWQIRKENVEFRLTSMQLIDQTLRMTIPSKRSSMKVCDGSKMDRPQLSKILEYKTWKKNSPFLYDMILRCVLYPNLPLLS